MCAKESRNHASSFYGFTLKCAYFILVVVQNMHLLFYKKKMESNMEIYFYCQNCNEKITTDQLALLNEGECPKCRTIEGFSSAPKSENDTFEFLTIINDTELLEKSFKE
jgi:hypothetical protein